MKEVKTAELYHDGKHQYVQTDEGRIRCDGLKVKDYVVFRYPAANGEVVEFCCETANVTTTLLVQGL